jgi:hypothetical protein
MTQTIRSRSLVVRAYVPWRRTALIAALALLAGLLFYVVYEWGRYDAGYDRLAVAQQRVESEVALERLDKTNRQLRTHLAELDTVRVGRAREQAEVARQAQELAFYQGIVEEKSTPALGVKMQQPRITPGTAAGRYRVRIALLRAGKPDDVVNGTLRLSVDGETGGVAKTLNMSDLMTDKQRELPISFRYFENFDQEIALPSGFEAERLTVELRATRKGATPLTQTFLWSVDR